MTQPLQKAQSAEEVDPSIEERRYQKRCNAIAAIKRKPEYQAMLEMDVTFRPPTPDVDFNWTHRPWERAVMNWRQSLRELAATQVQSTKVAK